LPLSAVSQPPPSNRRFDAPARRGKNINGYFGETIDIGAVQNDCAAAARAHGWAVEELPVPGKAGLWVFVRAGSREASSADLGQGFRPTRRVYLSSGIHGDEPAGPLAMCRLLQQNQWPAHCELWLCPCLNPTGFLHNRRETPEGVDLNREYLEPTAPETRTHISWLERQPAFDICLCLHEDWEAHGFYLYELNPDNQLSLAEAMIGAVSTVCPIDTSELIEGRPAREGIIRPNLDPRSRPQWPEAFYLLTHKTRLSYTLEAPSDYPLEARVEALVTAVRAALR
jgi:protein MpaA